MNRSMTVYLPESGSQAMIALLSSIFRQQIDVHALPPEPLRLERLKCFHIRISGSVMQSRAPFVYPLMSDEFHRYYLSSAGQPLSAIPGADWVCLGGQGRDFALAMARHMAANSIRHVVVRPFTSVEGTFPRDRQRGDKIVTMCKQPNLHNDRCVKEIKDKLLAVDPARWDSRDYCLVADRYDTIRPLIHKHLAVSPKTIVDVGCGLGNTTNSLAIAYPDAQVIGFDFSETSINVARKSFPGPNLRFEVGDFTRPLPLPDGGVDLLVSVEATNMSVSPAMTAREFCRVLSGNGLIVNVSLSESAYVYWDYPASLFFPTHLNTFATDWFYTVRAAGFGFRLEPWGLESFTFLPCRDVDFLEAHRAFERSRRDSDTYLPYHDRFAMIIGPGVKSDKPCGAYRHLLETNYLTYVALCLESHDPGDAELDRFTRWGAALVREYLGLMPGAYEFCLGILPQARAFPAHDNARLPPFTARGSGIERRQTASA